MVYVYFQIVFFNNNDYTRWLSPLLLKTMPDTEFAWALMCVYD